MVLMDEPVYSVFLYLLSETLFDKRQNCTTESSQSENKPTYEASEDNSILWRQQTFNCNMDYAVSLCGQGYLSDTAFDGRVFVHLSL